MDNWQIKFHVSPLILKTFDIIGVVTTDGEDEKHELAHTLFAMEQAMNERGTMRVHISMDPLPLSSGS